MVPREQSRLDKAEGVVTKKLHTQGYHPRLDGIPDPSFVCLLQCYVAFERLENVAPVDEAFELTGLRSGANAALAEILRGAQRAKTSCSV
jgi:hypothetical protein